MAEAAAGLDDAVALAKAWRTNVEEAAAWLAAAPAEFVVVHGATLRAAGMDAEAVGYLYPRLAPAVAADLARLVDAGRMADVEVRWLHWWARSGLLQSAPSGRRGGRGGLSYTTWVTQARLFISACGGDQEMAALAAAAGLNPGEAARKHADGALDREVLRTMAALQ